MDLYFINTSKRTGYTSEKPSIDFFINNDELIYNNEQFDKSLLSCAKTEKIFKVSYTEDRRGDIEECGVKYFTDQADANKYYKDVQSIRTNKTISPYKINEYVVFNSVLDIPIKDKTGNTDENRLCLQKLKYTDYRLNSNLTFEEKLKKFVNGRNNSISI